MTERNNKHVRFNSTIDVFKIPNTISSRPKRTTGRVLPTDIQALASILSNMFYELAKIGAEAKTQTSSSLSMRVRNGDVWMRDFFKADGIYITRTSQEAVHAFGDMLVQLNQYYRIEVDIVIRAKASEYKEIQRIIASMSSSIISTFNGQYLKESLGNVGGVYYFKTSLPKLTKINFQVFLEDSRKLQFVTFTFHYLDEAIVTPLADR